MWWSWGYHMSCQVVMKVSHVTSGGHEGITCHVRWSWRYHMLHVVMRVSHVTSETMRVSHVISGGHDGITSHIRRSWGYHVTSGGHEGITCHIRRSWGYHVTSGGHEGITCHIRLFVWNNQVRHSIGLSLDLCPCIFIQCSTMPFILSSGQIWRRSLNIRGSKLAQWHLNKQMWTKIEKSACVGVCVTFLW